MNLIEAQTSTVSAMTDALFGQKKTSFTPAQDIQQTIQTARMLHFKKSELREQFPDNRGNIEQAEEFMLCAIINLEGHLIDMAEGKENYAECTCGKCDGCVAARSDEQYDRKKDGELIARSV